MKKDKVFEINNRQELEKKAACAVLRLKQLYKDAACSLEFGSEGWRLMVMGRLSAQCTDKRVNIVCRELFEKYPTPYDLANASLEEVENIIRPCGLYRTKARDIIGECKMLVEDYGSVVPDCVEELILFPGVGRKIANLLVSDIYGKPAIVADTHCIRISGRLGLVDSSDPYKVERVLSEIVEKEEQSHFCHRLVSFGRDICLARGPKCSICPLVDICDGAKEKQKGGNA